MELWRVPSALMRIAIMSMSMAFGNLVKSLSGRSAMVAGGTAMQMAAIQ